MWHCTAENLAARDISQYQCDDGFSLGRGRLSVKVAILRGSKEIGGTCIRLTSAGESILIDLGRPLKTGGPELDLAGKPPIGVLISHPHQDHYGLIEALDSSVPVYMSELSQKLIEAVRLFLGQGELPNTISHFERDREQQIGPFRITPFLVDHSSPEAFAFLVEAEGKRVFYSGDFRAHGRKAVLLHRLMARPPSDIDLLFLEGTTLGRSTARFPDEESVRRHIERELKDNEGNLAFLVSSGQNVDRLVSAYKACRRTGRELVLDPYGAWILELMKLVTNGVPAVAWDGVRVCVSGNQYGLIKERPEMWAFTRSLFAPGARVEWDEIESAPGQFLWLVRHSASKLIQHFSAQALVALIYSQWLGYLDQEDLESPGAEEMRKLRDDPGVQFSYAHTSGHASQEDLGSFVRALAPAAVAPVHTEHPESYSELYPDVMLMEDGVEIQI